MSSTDGLTKRHQKVVNKSKVVSDESVPSVVSAGVSPQTPLNSIVRRVMSRVALSVAILVTVYYTTKSNETTELVMASVAQSIKGSPVGQEVVCSEDYNEDRQRFKLCAPKRCGRFVSDSVITQSEAKHLLSVAKRGLSLGGSSGGASIVDLHTGALSMGTNFVNIYKLIENNPQKDQIFNEKDFEIYRSVKNKILQTIAMHFGVSPKHIYLTDPTFFSRLTGTVAQTKHDEYWHKHIDKQTYKSFHFTSLLYLTTFGTDFSGGRFIFTDKTTNNTVAIEPKLGRLSAFTSGSENEHFVERVTAGTRYAITVSFTCDPKHAISDPKIVTKKNL